jgi:hypothetical protein
MTIRKIKPDGNCFFRALTDQISGWKDGHIVLRTLITDFISEKRANFENFIDQEHFPSWEDFIHQMHRPGTFPDGTMVAASPPLLRRSIVIHQYEQCPHLFNSPLAASNNNHIHLIYHSKTLHYDSLCSINDENIYIDESGCAPIWLESYICFNRYLN